MRPYRMPCGHHIDLDHVLSIGEPKSELGSAVISVSMMFRDAPFVFVYASWDIQRLGLGAFEDRDGEDYTQRQVRVEAAVKGLVWQPLYDAWSKP